MSQPSILVVDDEPGMLRVVERLLGGKYAVTSCRSANEALSRAPAVKPEIALLDIRMPEMSGFDLMDRLHAVCPDLYVIFMTGSTSQLDATLIRTIRSKAFYFIQKPFERELLLTLVERCAEQRRLWVENRQLLDRLQRELNEAKTFQHSLLPANQATLAGVGIAARYVPTSEMAGDFFDYAQADDHRISVMIADAAGHGVTAAMLTGVVKFAFDSSHVDGYEPLSVTHRIMSGICDFESHRFVSLFCARIDTRNRTIEYVNAGHPAACLWGRRREMTLLESTGSLLSSVFEGGEWMQEQIATQPGDQLLLYTDGVIECDNRIELFGRSRLVDIIRRNASGGEPMLEEIIRELRTFSGRATALDDIALLAASLPDA